MQHARMYITKPYCYQF